MTRIGPMTLMLALALVGCSEKKDKNEAVQEEGALNPAVTDSHKTEVDATSYQQFSGFDLDSGTFISTADFANNTTWDLAFKRTTVKMNSEVKMQIVADADYDELKTAPKDGYIADEPATAGATETTGLAFHTGDPWYVYDINTHVVTSRSFVYVVASNDGRHFKLKFTDYYNAERLSGFVNFEYQELSGEAP